MSAIAKSNYIFGYIRGQNLAASANPAGKNCGEKKKDPLLIFWVLLVGSPPFPVPGTRMTAHRPAKCRNLGPYMRSGIVDTERVTSEPGKFGLGLILLNVSESLTCYMNFAAQDGFFEGFCIITSI